MTPERQQIVIAESLGWKPHYSGDGFASHPIHAPKQMVRIPDYLNSRDAMAEALARLNTESERALFSRNLLKLVGLHQPHFDGQECFLDYFACAAATPAQLAEAYLRTKGLWEE